MSDPDLKDANLPQEEWNPPGGVLDFDELFGGAGDGSSDIIQVQEAQSQTVEPSTSTTEPEPQVTEPTTQQTQSTEPTQRTLTQDPTGKFVPIKTRTGTLYNSLEEVVKGTVEKDELIANMRKMLESVTGQDPVKTIKQTQSGEVSYLQDANRYAKDKEQAANYGQKTGDWRPYRDVEAKLQLELIQQTVGQYAPVVQKASRQEALDETTKEIPEFKAFYGTEDYRQALESRPKLKIAVEYAEQNSQGDLPELYKSVFDAHTRRKLPELLKQSSPSNPTIPRMPLDKSTLTAPKVVTENTRGAQASNPLSNSASRKQLIADYEARGVLDRAF